MPFHLKGVAKIWFDSIQAAKQTSLRLLREAFVARFKPQSNIYISMLSLAQKAKESVEGTLADSLTNSDIYNH